MEDCRIWEIYDAALTNQGDGTNTQENITYRRNVIWNSEYSFEYWNRGSSSLTRNVVFEHNTCVDAGYGWGHDIQSSAIRVEGNNHLIEYNEVFSVVTESDDQGGIDIFGNPTFRGNIFRYNYWHHIGAWRETDEQPACGQCAIRLDDAISGTLIKGNIMERNLPR